MRMGAHEIEEVSLAYCSQCLALAQAQSLDKPIALTHKSTTMRRKKAGGRERVEGISEKASRDETAPASGPRWAPRKLTSACLSDGLHTGTSLNNKQHEPGLQCTLILLPAVDRNGLHSGRRFRTKAAG